jgi:hypothetical protein
MEVYVLHRAFPIKGDQGLYLYQSESKVVLPFVTEV